MLVRFEATPWRRRTAPAPSLPRDNHAWISLPEVLGNETFSALSTAGGAPIAAREGPARSPHPDASRPPAAITANGAVRHEIGRVPEDEMVTAMFGADKRGRRCLECIPCFEPARSCSWEYS